MGRWADVSAQVPTQRRTLVAHAIRVSAFSTWRY